MILVGRRLTAQDLQRLQADPSLTDELIEEDDDMPDHLDLDKSWHALHFLLAGTEWEPTEGAGEAVLGGEPIGEDVGYGPARLLTADQVHVIADHLRGLDIDALRARYDANALTA